MPPGGGGLVILPHKSWNVWNEDNKAKVARDEQANAQLIQAQEQCRKKVLQQIRFERLTGKTITKQQQEARIEYALDNIDINEHIKDESMRNIAKNMNDKMQREKMEKHQNKNKKRKYKDMNKLSEEQIKYGPRKRHKRNDVSIIEDHYSHKSKFEFDPEQYNTVNDNKNVHNDNKHNNNSHFSLFNERDLRSKYNEKGYANQDSIKEQKHKKEMEDKQFKLGRTEIESRGNRKPWYLMTIQREIDRRMLMKSDSIQHSLPRRLKDYNRNTDALKEKAINRKNMDDPMNLMKEYLKKQKEIKRNDSVSVDNERDNMQFYDSLKRKRELKKQKREVLREKVKRKKKKQRSNDGYSDCSDYESGGSHKKKKKKRKKHKHNKSSKKNKKKHSHLH